MKRTWGEMVEQARRNDQTAFYDLYQYSYDAIYRTVKSMVRDEDAVLDIVQDAFVKGFASLSSLEDPEQFLPWMKRIATNKAKDWFRKKQEITFSQLADEDGNEPDFEDERTEYLPEAVIDRNETARLIEEILRELPDEQRMVIGMFYYQNMSIPEIAYELGISENTVKSRLNYGKKKIRASVEDLEKKGTKLYSLAPIPFLLLLFRNQMLQFTAGSAPVATFGSILSAVSGTASTAASTAYASAAAANNAATGAASAGTAAASCAATGAGGGLLASIGAKIAIGLIAIAVVGGGIGARTYLANRDSEQSESSAVSEGISSAEDSSASAELSAEELLTRYLEEKLIPEKGIYDIQQPSYQDIAVTVYRIDTTYDPVTGEFHQEENQDFPYEEYRAARENQNISGLFLSDFYDYDGDGDAELLVAYGKDGKIWLELFDTKENQVTSVGKLSQESLDFDVFAYGRTIKRITTTDGETRLMVDSEDDGIVGRRYMISNELKLTSRLDLRYSSNYWEIVGNDDADEYYYYCDVTEYFYDSETEDTARYEAKDGGNNYGSFLIVYDKITAAYGGGHEELLCRLYTVGIELNDFFRKYYNFKGNNGSNNNPGSTDNPGAAEDPGANMSTEERLMQFFEKELLPAKGIYDLSQPSYYSYMTGISCITNTYDRTAGKFRQDVTAYYAAFNKAEYDKQRAAYEAAKKSTDISGVYCAELYDFDGDREPELLTMYGERGVKYLEVFDVADGKVVSAGKVSFTDLGGGYGWRAVNYNPAGGGCIVLYDTSEDFDRCYRFSGKLELLSVITVDYDGPYDAVEVLYDGGREKTVYLDEDDLEDALAKYGMDEDFDSNTLHTFFVCWEVGGVQYKGNNPSISMENYWIQAHR